MKKRTVGLFGTCGKSTWRDEVIAEFEKVGVQYFNPNRPDWTPECAVEEAKHMAEDEIIVFVVTGETTSFASLAEVGIAIANVLTSKEPRYIALMIDETLNDGFDLALTKESNNARAIVTQHIRHNSRFNGDWIKRVFLFNRVDMLTQFVTRLAFHEDAF